MEHLEKSKQVKVSADDLRLYQANYGYMLNKEFLISWCKEGVANKTLLVFWDQYSGYLLTPL